MTRLLSIGLVLCFASTLTNADTIRAGVAISLKETFEQIVPSYERLTGDRVELTFGASGQIAAQIKNGAPIDLFVSAAQTQIDELAKNGRIDASASRVLCGNQLVLIVPPALANPPTSFESLAKLNDTRIAIGEPASVPAGSYAMQVFKTLQLDASLKGKLVYGANVRQVLAYVERGEVAAGVVYATDALQAGDRVKVAAIANAQWHPPIIYPGVVVAASKNADAAKRFLDYLQTPDAQVAMISRGFTVPPAPTSQPAR